ncbi:MAG: DUF2213 domain-containing protein [Nannocystales bacterium]
MKRYRRYDFVCPFVFRDEAPSRTVGSATHTDEGYLQVDGYLARSGLLEYSDGVESWTEYRSKQEVHEAAASWLRTPVTDEHPEEMVDSSNWTQLARGHLLHSVSIETLADGEDYIRASLLVTDLSLVDKITNARGPRELSIGFTAAIMPTENGLADDGTRCDAVQLSLEGNHVAVVSKGRAGPAARLLMDGAAYLSMNPRIDTSKKLVQIVGPDGRPFQAPAWLAAIYEKTLVPSQPQPAAPAAPAAPPPAPAPAAPAAPQAPAMAQLDVAGESVELPQQLVSQLQAFLATPEGRAAEDRAIAERGHAADAAEVTKEFMVRSGFDGTGDISYAMFEAFKQRRMAAAAADAPRQDAADEDEVDEDHPAVQFMVRNGYR